MRVWMGILELIAAVPTGKVAKYPVQENARRTFFKKIVDVRDQSSSFYKKTDKSQKQAMRDANVMRTLLRRFPLLLTLDLRNTSAVFKLLTVKRVCQIPGFYNFLTPLGEITDLLRPTLKELLKLYLDAELAKTATSDQLLPHNGRYPTQLYCNHICCIREPASDEDVACCYTVEYMTPGTQPVCKVHSFTACCAVGCVRLGKEFRLEVGSASPEHGVKDVTREVTWHWCPKHKPAGWVPT